MIKYSFLKHKKTSKGPRVVGLLVCLFIEVSRVSEPLIAAAGHGIVGPPSHGSGQSYIKAQPSPDFFPSLEFGGRIVPAIRVDHFAPFEGRVTQEWQSVGRKVEARQPVMTLTRTTLGQRFADTQITANIAGTIEEFYVRRGSDFSAGTKLFTLVDTRQLLVRFLIGDADLDAVQVGKKITIVSSTGKESGGTVSYRSLAPIDKTGVFRAEATLDPKSDGWQIGQFVVLRLHRTGMESQPTSTGPKS